jgi:hypothetical protein
MGQGQYEVISQLKDTGFRTLRTLNREFLADKVYTMSAFFRHETESESPVAYAFSLSPDDESKSGGYWVVSMDMVNETVSVDSVDGEVEILNVGFEKYVNKWFRFSVTFKPSIDSHSNINKVISFLTAYPEAEFGIWGAMLNEGWTAPYIPTTTSTVTSPNALLNIYDLNRYLTNVRNGVILVEFETTMGVANNRGIFEVRGTGDESVGKLRQYIAGDTPEDRIIWQYTGGNGTSIAMGQPENQNPTTMNGRHRVATSFDMIGNNVRHQASIDGNTGALTDEVFDGLFDVAEMYIASLSSTGAFSQDLIVRKVEIYSTPKWYGSLTLLTSLDGNM